MAESRNNASGPEVVVASPNDVEKDFQKYGDMNKPWREDLQRAVARYIASQTRQELADRVLDLAIAYEISLASKGDRQNQVPLGWKVSVRTALIIGGPIDEPEGSKHTVPAQERYRPRSRGR